MEFTIKYGQELSIADFGAILTLDCKIFGNDVLTNEGLAEKRFLKFKDGIIAAYIDSNLIGFISFFNVATTIYERGAFGQEYIDDNLSDADIKPFEKDTANNILLLDLAVEESFRHKGVSKQLHDSTRDFLREKHQNDYSIEKIFGYAITPEGVRSMLSFDGRVIWTKDKINFFEINERTFLRLA